MRVYLNLLLSILMLALLVSCNDDETEVQPQTDYTSADEFFESLDFSGSVLIEKGSSEILRKGYGYADVTAGEFNSKTHVYRIGSMTKAFTAVGIIHLKRDGLIESYDQPISDFTDEFPFADQITLRQLLTHHSGIPDYTGAVETLSASQNQDFTPEEIFEILVEGVAEEGLNFEPGTEFEYSNSNYLLLGLLIEALSGQNYHDYLKTKIFDPLGMFATKEGPNEMSGAPYAKGYLNGSEVTPYRMQIAYSAGDLVSNLEDMEKWAKALMGDTYLTAAEKEELFAEPYSEDGYNTIGFGWFTIKIEGKLMYYHGGDINGFTSFIGLLPDSNGVIVMLSNEQDKGEMRNLIQETITINEF